MIMLGAIVQGPRTEQLVNIIGPAYTDLIGMIDDSSSKVRNGVAWTFFRIVEHAPLLIVHTTDNLHLFVSKTLQHLEDNMKITLLLLNAL
jgi:hypothetical protein